VHATRPRRNTRQSPLARAAAHVDVAPSSRSRKSGPGPTRGPPGSVATVCRPWWHQPQRTSSGATVAPGPTACSTDRPPAGGSTSDMTQLTLGLDRDSRWSRALRRARPGRAVALVAQAIRAWLERGQYVGICGQGPSAHPTSASGLVERGSGPCQLTSTRHRRRPPGSTWQGLRRDLRLVARRPLSTSADADHDPHRTPSFLVRGCSPQSIAVRMPLSCEDVRVRPGADTHARLGDNGQRPCCQTALSACGGCSSGCSWPRHVIPRAVRGRYFSRGRAPRTERQ
jgi:hypothetical protein